MNAESQRKQPYQPLVWVVVTLVFATGLGLAVAQQTDAGADTNSSSSSEPTSEKEVVEARKQKSLAAFRQVATVLRHPRCLNCHPKGDRPHVGDARKLHDMNVQRGPDNKGMAGLHCATCHRDENQAVPEVPGAPHWHLAPRSMAWEDMDDRELATMLLDPKRNGNRSHEDLIKHMGTDPLVLWGWEPGGDRSVPPLNHKEFMSALKTWLNNGAAIPYPGETTF